jgi:hypothetical protein
VPSPKLLAPEIAGVRFVQDDEPGAQLPLMSYHASRNAASAAVKALLESRELPAIRSSDEVDCRLATPSMVMIIKNNSATTKTAPCWREGAARGLRGRKWMFI